MAQPIVGASDVPTKLVRRKTASTKISEYEDALLNLVAEKCGETRSTVISQAIRYLLVEVLRGDDGSWKLPEDDPALTRIMDILEKESNEFITKCKSKLF